MDSARFDAATRVLGTPVGRRAGLRAALAAVVTAAAGRPDSASAARVPSAQGPCGNGSVKANKCNGDAQCCPGTFCDRSKTPKGAKGRCRRRPDPNPNPACVPTGKAGCSGDADCCAEEAGCFAGTCQLL